MVIAATGKHFSAGADLDWMRRMAGYSHEENLADAMALARLLQAIDTCPKPVVARVQGTAFAGGAGPDRRRCDIAIAAEHATFAVSEVRLGLIPAVISPYVVRAVGARRARRWFLTAERFSTPDRTRRRSDPRGGAGRGPRCCGRCGRRRPAEGESVGAGGGQAAGAAGSTARIDEAVIAETARLIADVRAGDEAREGLDAFFAKRKPRWQA